MHFVQRKNSTLHQCCGSGSASFWEVGSGSASERNTEPDLHQSQILDPKPYLHKVKIQERWRFRMEPWGTVDASGWRFLSLWWGAGSGPHLSLRSNPYPICIKVKGRSVSASKWCGSSKHFRGTYISRLTCECDGLLFQFKSLLTLFLHRRTRRVSSRWPSTRA